MPTRPYDNSVGSDDVLCVIHYPGGWRTVRRSDEYSRFMGTYGTPWNLTEVTLGTDWGFARAAPTYAKLPCGFTLTEWHNNGTATEERRFRGMITMPGRRYAAYHLVLVDEVQP
jgi:hypothetical protein